MQQNGSSNCALFLNAVGARFIARSLKALSLLQLAKKRRAQADRHSYGMRIAPGNGKPMSGA